MAAARGRHRDPALGASPIASTAPTPPRLRTFRPLLGACERRLADAVADGVPDVAEPALQTLAAGGKRVRPLLVFCAGAGAVSDEGHLVSAATSVELVHMATLVHDDLIDGATMRRGLPTIVDALGAETAIQTGDFLFARAFAELTTTGSPPAVRALAQAALALSQGEMDQQRAAFDLALTEDAYLERCRRKTAALFAVACRLGAVVSGASPEATERLTAFGENVGVAFQIFDDILDLAGAPAATGKRRGTDLRDGTVTLPVILALRIEPGLAQEVEVAHAGGHLEALCDRLAAHRGLELARTRALDFVAAARESLDGDVGSADSEAMLAVADAVVDRYQ